MKHNLIFLRSIFCFPIHSIAQEKKDECHLNETKLEYFYQNGSAVQSNFEEGQFNFNQHVFSTSALLGTGTDDQQILFDAGIIEQLKLKEK